MACVYTNASLCLVICTVQELNIVGTRANSYKIGLNVERLDYNVWLGVTQLF